MSDGRALHLGRRRRFAVTIPGRRRFGQRELHTEARRSEASYPGYTIKLLELQPYPEADRPIRPEDYVAMLTVAAKITPGPRHVGQLVTQHDV